MAKCSGCNFQLARRLFFRDLELFWRGWATSIFLSQQISKALEGTRLGFGAALAGTLVEILATTRAKASAGILAEHSGRPGEHLDLFQKRREVNLLIYHRQPGLAWLGRDRRSRRFAADRHRHVAKTAGAAALSQPGGAYGERQPALEATDGALRSKGGERPRPVGQGKRERFGAADRLALDRCRRQSNQVVTTPTEPISIGTGRDRLSTAGRWLR